MITGINMIRNGIENGYPFVESILSVLPLVDEYLMNDGGSTDGTLEVLLRLQKIFPKIKIYQIPDKSMVRWDCISNVINKLIKKAQGNWIFLGNSDELLHENDIVSLRKLIEETDWPIVRFQRREVSKNWSKLSDEVYHPARAARKTRGLYQNWNSYGGDEFLTSEGWIDPKRKLQSDIIIYHLYAVFPLNMLNKRRNDAERLAPGDSGRVKIYENLKNSKRDWFKPPNHDRVYPKLPALAKGLTFMGAYEVREELFDPDWLWQKTGLIYDDL